MTYRLVKAIVIAAVLAAVLAVVLESLPDIKRYLKLRNM